MTEKGLCYKIESLQKSSKGFLNKIGRHIETLNLLVTEGTDTNVVESLRELDKLHNELLQASSILQALGDISMNNDFQSTYLDITTAKMNALKLSEKPPI